MSTLCKLKIADLRLELEERDLSSTGKKADLVERLKNALQEEGQDPETYLFEDKHAAVISSTSKVSSDVSKVSTDITLLENKVSSEISQVSSDVSKVSSDVSKVSTDITSLEKKVSSEISQVSSDVLKVSTDIASLEKKVSGDISSLDSKMTNEISKVTSDFDDKISSIKSTFEEKIKEIEKKLEETEKVDKVVEPILTDIKDDETKYKVEPRSIVEGSVGHARVKVPNFDGKSSWNNYMKQFESAARANGWSEKEKAVNLSIALRGDALDVLQTIAVEETDDFEQLKKRLNMRYGHEHLEHVYQSQFKNRRQKKDEALQEYEVDIARLVRYAYPTAPEDMMEKLAVQTFIDGLRDHEMQRTLRLARHKTLVDVLSAALEYESATQAFGGYSKVRTVKEEQDEDKLDQLVNMMKDIASKKTKTIRCWNCGEMGHVRSSCKYPRYNNNQETHQQEN
ncbi:scaffold attachment factor B1-like [Diabrotica virgifera virgifera]|uniref:Uncharacterized protein n=1 Tax=Diabrotica virgifera virgifera TaxID=50390 RepID=A0ABM5KGL4_DIAVI|nr:scaffold attachment factor B1-like [Diabrotica virgifera virgifera]